MLAMNHFKIFVSYSQVAVFDPTMDLPFNDWAEPHIAQGFAWRPASVSFGTLLGGGDMEVEFCHSKSLTVAPEAVRAIRVPFTIMDSGKVQITSISGDGPTLEVTPGQYDLLFETFLLPDGEMASRFTLAPASGRPAAVLRQDPELHPPQPLIMEASPA